MLSRAWLALLTWLLATAAAKITLPPLPASKGHVPGINPESPRLAPWFGTATNWEHWGAGDAPGGSRLSTSTRFGVLSAPGSL